MRKKYYEYKVWIFDLDGTLYKQLPVRVEMAMRLIMHYMIRPFKLRELLMLRQYRKMREKPANDSNFHQQQIQEMSQRYNMSTDEVSRVIDYWLIKRPLNVLKRWQRAKVLSTIRKHQTQGTTIIVYSDYPVADKLHALNLQADYEFWSNDDLIKCMKPNPQGLQNIIKHLKLNPQDILYVGDRNDKDGKCSESVGIDYLDINEFEKLI